jgi:cholesterol transport system auxiliary component
MKKLALIALVPLAGCISLTPKPPKALLTLTSSAAVPVGQTATSANAKTILIHVPVAPAAIGTQRVPVQSGETAIAYVKDALWVEPPTRLFARLLSDTVAAKTGRVVLSATQSYTDPGARLLGELRNFGVDSGSHQAVVTYDASLMRDGSTAVEKRRFEARVPVSTIDAANSGEALNQAANQVAGQVADWIGG